MTLLVGQIIPRQDTAANWTSSNPVLGSFEQGFETDTGLSKRGDNVTAWNALAYESSTGGEWGTITGDIQDQTDLIALINGGSDASRLISGGALTVINTDDLVVATSQFYIEGFGTFSAPEETFPNIALSAAGLVRYVDVYGLSDGTLSIEDGVEGTQAVHATPPANSVLINYSLVTDGVVGSSPDLSGYLLRADKATAAEVVAGTAINKYIDPLELYLSGVTGYSRSLHILNLSLADSTTYYVGDYTPTSPQTSNREVMLIPILKTGTITSVAIQSSASVVGSAQTEFAVLKVVIIDSSTSPASIGSTDNGLVSRTTITSTLKAGSDYQIVTTSIAVTAGQRMRVEITTPVYTTNPVSVRMNFAFSIK